MIQALKIGNPSLRGPCSDQLSPTFQKWEISHKELHFQLLENLEDWPDHVMLEFCVTSLLCTGVVTHPLQAHGSGMCPS